MFWMVGGSTVVGFRPVRAISNGIATIVAILDQPGGKAAVRNYKKFHFSPPSLFGPISCPWIDNPYTRGARPKINFDSNALSWNEWGNTKWRRDASLWPPRQLSKGELSAEIKKNFWQKLLLFQTGIHSKGINRLIKWTFHTRENPAFSTRVYDNIHRIKTNVHTLRNRQYNSRSLITGNVNELVIVTRGPGG